jgi:hypothetical protein
MKIQIVIFVFKRCDIQNLILRVYVKFPFILAKKCREIMDNLEIRFCATECLGSAFEQKCSSKSVIFYEPFVSTKFDQVKKIIAKKCIF